MAVIKLSPFLKDIFLTSLTSVVSILSMIIMARLLAQGLGPELFGVYSLARRIVSNVVPLAGLSMGISLARYIALSRDRKQISEYLVSSLLIVMVATIIIILFFLCWGNTLTVLFFHNSRYLLLFYGVLLMLIGYGLFTILYAFYRGLQKMNYANLWQLLIIALFPLIISFLFAEQGSAELILFLMGTALFISVFPLGHILKDMNWPGFNRIRKSTKELLRYGIPRTPGDFAFAGLLTVGPFLSAYFGSLKDAGYFVIGQTVFRVMESSLVAFGLVALPKVTQLFAEGRDQFLKMRIIDTMTLILHLGLFVSIQIFIWSEEIIKVWLGPEYLEAIPIMEILLFSLCPYLGYVMLRSIVDAVEVKAINTLNLFISLGLAIVLSVLFGYAGLGGWGIAVGTAVGFVILGLLTANYLIKRYQITFESFLFIWILFLNSVFAGFAFWVKQYLGMLFSGMSLLTVAFFVEAILFVVYIWLIYKKNAQWIVELKKRIIVSKV